MKAKSLEASDGGSMSVDANVSVASNDNRRSFIRCPYLIKVSTEAGYQDDP